MESEKVKEIKKALECCSEGKCEKCLIGKKDIRKCVDVLLKDALTLINELESENERLQNKNYQLEQDLGQCENGYKLELHTARCQLHSANEDLKKAENRIAELEKRCHFILALGYDYDGCEKAESLKSLIDELVGIAQGNWGDVCSKCENKQDNLINDKLKQFAERLKDDIEHHHGNYGDLSYSECEHIVDETLKEFIDGN